MKRTVFSILLAFLAGVLLAAGGTLLYELRQIHTLPDGIEEAVFLHITAFPSQYPDPLSAKADSAYPLGIVLNNTTEQNAFLDGFREEDRLAVAQALDLTEEDYQGHTVVVGMSIDSSITRESWWRATGYRLREQSARFTFTYVEPAGHIGYDYATQEYLAILFLPKTDFGDRILTLDFNSAEPGFWENLLYF